MSESLVYELRRRLALHDEWPTKETRAEIVDVARRLIQAIDMRAQMIEHMRATITPTDQAIGEIMTVWGGTDTTRQTPPWADSELRSDEVAYQQNEALQQRIRESREHPERLVPRPLRPTDEKG